MGVIKTEVEMRKNASILAFMEMRRDSEGYNTSERAGTHLNNPETRASSLDYTLSFHIGVMLRVAALQRGAPTPAHRWRFTPIGRRWEQAAESYDNLAANREPVPKSSKGRS